MYKIKMLKRLNGRQRNEIRELEAECKSIDNTKSIACLDIEYNQENPLKCFYLGYKVERNLSASPVCMPLLNGVTSKAEDKQLVKSTESGGNKAEKLISFAAIYLADSEESMAEMIGFVHPSERRKGYFKKLLSKAKKELKNAGIDVIELIHEPISKAALNMLVHIEAHYNRSEYLLAFDNLTIPNISKGISLCIEEAKIEDIDVIINIYKELFDYNYNEQNEIYLRLKGIIQSDSFILYKALADINAAGTHDNIIGFCSVAEDENIYCIFDFGISKVHQNKGYGITMLAHLITELRKHIDKSGTQRKIVLHVSSKNEAAFNMYKNFGFEIHEQYDYYRINI